MAFGNLRLISTGTYVHLDHNSLESVLGHATMAIVPNRGRTSLRYTAIRFALPVRAAGTDGLVCLRMTFFWL